MAAKKRKERKERTSLCGPCDLWRQLPAPRARAAAVWATAALAFALPAPAPSQVDLDLDAIGGAINEGVASYGLELRPDWQKQAADALDGNVNEILMSATKSLEESTTPEEMAELQPLLRELATHAREIPELQPYAQWLETRLDYFDAAREATALAPAPAPKPPVKPVAKPPPPRPGVRRPPTPRPAPPPAAVRLERHKLATSPELWRRRVATHAQPAKAEELVPKLKAIFRSEGVPEELVWMAEVESSMQPATRSPAGAAGLFQLMPGTAKELGLRTAPPPDERLDPERNAGAAARLLRRLYGRFQSWPLALSAYNAGEARVAGLLKKAGGSTLDDICAVLPMETQMYVPRVMETVRLREKIDPAKLPPPRG